MLFFFQFSMYVSAVYLYNLKLAFNYDSTVHLGYDSPQNSLQHKGRVVSMYTEFSEPSFVAVMGVSAVLVRPIIAGVSNNLLPIRQLRNVIWCHQRVPAVDWSYCGDSSVQEEYSCQISIIYSHPFNSICCIYLNVLKINLNQSALFLFL